METTTKRSILLQETEAELENDSAQTPVFFVDLHLDQIVEAMTAGREEYNLKPFFCRPLTDRDAVAYRQEIFQDLECPPLFEHIGSFVRRMQAMREHLVQAEKLYYKYQKESWFLDAVDLYCDTVKCLLDDLSAVDLESRGFLAFFGFLSHHVASAPFADLVAETKKLKADLLTVKYCVLLKGNVVRVRKYGDEIDYSAEVEQTFAKFKQGTVKDYRVKFSNVFP
jgi:DNA mismatch repair protein MutS